jgi:hypothetical protein
MHPEYHAEDPFKIIERIGEVFVLVDYPAGSQREYAIWRANLHIGSRSFVGEGTSPEYAIHRERRPDLCKSTKQWAALLIEGFQACDLVERERNLPVVTPPRAG